MGVLQGALMNSQFKGSATRGTTMNSHLRELPQFALANSPDSGGATSGSCVPAGQSAGLSLNDPSSAKGTQCLYCLSRLQVSLGLYHRSRKRQSPEQSLKNINTAEQAPPGAYISIVHMYCAWALWIVFHAIVHVLWSTCTQAKAWLYCSPACIQALST